MLEHGPYEPKVQNDDNTMCKERTLQLDLVVEGALDKINGSRAR